MYCGRNRLPSYFTHLFAGSRRYVRKASTNNELSPCASTGASGLRRWGGLRPTFRLYSSDYRGEEPTESYAGGYRSPATIVKDEFRRYFQSGFDEPEVVPKETDIVIIGGGALGMSAAYWLKQCNPEGFTVTLIERDPTYTRAATVLSVGGIRQQFSLEENIRMSLFSAEFFRNIKEHLSVLDLDPPDIQFNHQGYLFLASDQGAKVMQENHRKQTSLGADVDLLSKNMLKAKFPWLNTDDLSLGSYGVKNEGWFDPWLYLVALKTKAASLGAKYVKGNVVGFTKEDIVANTGTSFLKRERLKHVHVKTDDGKVHPIQFAMCLNCAGPWSREVARLSGIGVGEDAMRFELPVEPRKRFVYVFHCPNGPGLETPMLIDTSGVYVRREGLGGNYICGASPPSSFGEPSASDLDVDYKFFEEFIWPQLAHRVPAFENLKLLSAWAGYYDYNYFDQNLIIGNHPYHRNFFLATGCSGHGIQHSPAIGRALMEYMTDDGYKTIDLTRMGFDRILDDAPLLEREIV